MPFFKSNKPKLTFHEKLAQDKEKQVESKSKTDIDLIDLIARYANSKIFRAALNYDGDLISTFNRGVWHEVKYDLRSRIRSRDIRFSLDILPFDKHLLSDLSLITKHSFKYIKIGMPLDEIITLLGSEGNIFTQDEIIELFDTTKMTSKRKHEYKRDLDVRVWMASVPSNISPRKGKENERMRKALINPITISVVFRDGVVVSKNQFELKKNKF